MNNSIKINEIKNDILTKLVFGEFDMFLLNENE